MFGYILPVKGEMKIKDFNAYRAYYCGLCKQLQASYGWVSRFLLNYDMVLLALMADALSGEEGTLKQEGCFAAPLPRRDTRRGTAGLLLGADALMLLSYHKLRDNMADEAWPKNWSYLLAHPYMKHLYRKAAARHPALDETLAAQMRRQTELEKAGCASADEACDPSAKMCEALFAEAAANEQERKALARLGLFAGQLVYLLDAAEDYPEDAKRGGYNVFIQAGLPQTEAVETARSRCRMAAGELAACYNLLTLRRNRAILDNIFYLGVPAAIAQAGTKQDRRTAKHGQITGI